MMKKGAVSKQHSDAIIKKHASTKKNTNPTKKDGPKTTTTTAINPFSHIINYLSRTRCLAENHTKLALEFCQKGCGYLCNQCQAESSQLEYVYLAKKNVCCYHHFLPACKLLVHFFRGNALILYNRTTGTKRKITLSNSADRSSDTIACDGRIFVMGGSTNDITGDHEEPLDELYEVNLKAKILISKAKMLFPNSNHTLCIVNKEICAISGFGHRCQKYSIKDDK